MIRSYTSSPSWLRLFCSCGVSGSRYPISHWPWARFARGTSSGDARYSSSDSARVLVTGTAVASTSSAIGFAPHRHGDGLAAFVDSHFVMDTALLVAGLPPPPPGAQILAGLDRPRARVAADAGVTMRVERVAWYVVLADVTEHLVSGPI